jgi:hypothetical protein
MNKLLKFSRLIIALVLAVSAVGFYTSHAQAAVPVKWSFAVTFDDVLSAGTLCPFDVNVSIYYAASGQDTFDGNGNLIKDSFHQSEQDTFTANGKIVTTDLYHNYGYWLFDSSGNVIGGYVEGNFGRYRLPDGNIISVNAGRTKLNPDGGWMWSSDNGNPGDLAAFCAALAP